MFEDKTFDNIMEDLLENVSDEIDKREGSIIYDSLSPCALELEQAYSDMSLIFDECFADSCSYYYLIKRAAEHGIIVEEGDQAVLKIKVSPTTVDISTGTEFTIGDYTYTTTENLGYGYYSITCTETGVDGNNTTDDVLPVDDIEGLEEVEVTDIITPGTDDEDEDSLRERFFESFQGNAFGGNCKDYIERADAMETVGGCKVTPAWNGGGTVKLHIINEEFNTPSEADCEAIRKEFDPDPGMGYGIAPIGHTVTVVPCEETALAMNAKVTLQDGYTTATVAEKWKSYVGAYFYNLRQKWESSDALTVLLSQVEQLLLNTEGVLTIEYVTINGISGNYALDQAIPTVSICTVELKE